MDYLKIEGLSKCSAEDLKRFIEHRQAAGRYWAGIYSNNPTPGAYSIWKMEEKIAQAFQNELDQRNETEDVVGEFMGYLDTIIKPKEKN